MDDKLDIDEERVIEPWGRTDKTERDLGNGATNEAPDGDTRALQPWSAPYNYAPFLCAGCLKNE